jgi:hypothetical protein
MANIFEITTATMDITADAAGKASAVFTATNTSNKPMRGIAKVKARGNTEQNWLDLEGEKERDFGAGSTQQFTVNFDNSADPAAGKYPFRLDVALAADPDEYFTEGPVVNIQTAAQAQPVKKGFPLWLMIVIPVVVLMIIGFALFLFLRTGGESNSNVKAVANAKANANADVVVANVANANVVVASANANADVVVASANVADNANHNVITNANTEVIANVNSNVTDKGTYTMPLVMGVQGVMIATRKPTPSPTKPPPPIPNFAGMWLNDDLKFPVLGATIRQHGDSFEIDITLVFLDHTSQGNYRGIVKSGVGEAEGTFNGKEIKIYFRLINPNKENISNQASIRLDFTLRKGGSVTTSRISKDLVFKGSR